ncbi:MAG TPA: hypothetical protein VF260_00835 [Bacilli bacterium]
MRDRAFAGMLLGGKALAATAFDVLRDASLLAEIKQEFARKAEINDEEAYPC